MAVKTANAKKSTVKKGLKGVSAPKVKRSASVGSRKMSELEKTTAMLAVSHAEAEAELKALVRVIKESELARLKDIEQRQKDRQKDIEQRQKDIEQRQKDLEQYQKDIEQYEKDREERKERDKNLNRWIGGLRNSIGSIVEMVLLPGFARKINMYGHEFTQASNRKEFYRKDGSRFAEIDLYLENRSEVMVVEAKALFNADGVDALLKRIQKLRAEETMTGVEGKTIFAAAAGIDFTDDARQMIEEKGIYMVTVNEDDDKILISPLSIEKAGKW